MELTWGNTIPCIACGHAQVAVPIGLSVLGLDRDELSARGHALLHLGLDLSQLGVTLGILWGCLRQFRPRKRGLFPMQLESAWTRRALLVVAIACCTFPGVDWVAQQSMVSKRGAGHIIVLTVLSVGNGGRGKGHEGYEV